jgi:AraC-like DNA-binding protein
MKASLLVDAPILDKKQIWVKKVHKPFFDHDYHFHQTEEICWIQSGHGNMVVGDHLGHFEKDDVLIFGKGLPHILRCDKSFEQKNSKKKTTAYSIYFTEEHIQSISDDPTMIKNFHQLLRKNERGYRLTGKEKEKALVLFQQVINNHGFGQLGCFLQLLELLFHCKQNSILASGNYQLLPSDTDMKRFSEVYDYLLKNFQQPISLDQVASICSMTTNSFCRFFKVKTQKTFVQFLTEIRIGHACKLLQDENLPIKNIVYDCGFNNPVLFHRSFLRITGSTPKKFRDGLMNLS